MTDKKKEKRSGTGRRGCWHERCSILVGSSVTANVGVGRLSLCWVLLLVVFVAACGGDGTTEPPPVPPPVSAAGAWRLSEIGERPLPTDIGFGGDCVTITAGGLTLRNDASYEQRVTFHACGAPNATISITGTGTWNQEGNLVDFVPAEGCADRAVATATALRFARDCSLAVPVVYVR